MHVSKYGKPGKYLSWTHSGGGCHTKNKKKSNTHVHGSYARCTPLITSCTLLRTTILMKSVSLCTTFFLFVVLCLHNAQCLSGKVHLAWMYSFMLLTCIDYVTLCIVYFRYIICVRCKHAYYGVPFQRDILCHVASYRIKKIIINTGHTLLKSCTLYFAQLNFIIITCCSCMH